ncbi:hypothetical protein [Staphylococcus aureus]|uniref:hypothetical protein n=1 Tax=Staphylococcus aureus TaxID=1280 RepID=UPI0016428901|nr:hypothetical protein [Staphylococcus aureus]
MKEVKLSEGEIEFFVVEGEGEEVEVVVVVEEVELEEIVVELVLVSGLIVIVRFV